LPELGPFNEPPFHVLPHLADKDWLARQPQWYFLAAIRNKSRQSARRLHAKLEPKVARRFWLEMAPTEYQKNDGVLRLMTREPTDASAWKAALNGVPLKPIPYVRKPIDHPYEGGLGEPGLYACFFCPRSAARAGRNDVQLELTRGKPELVRYIDVVLP
jgi:hypothetical protein